LAVAAGREHLSVDDQLSDDEQVLLATEVAAIFHVEPRTVSGHRRFRASEVRRLLSESRRAE
jgi:ABC-type uncharacterized transport system YnjBCD ATPase subunit